MRQLTPLLAFGATLVLLAVSSCGTSTERTSTTLQSPPYFSLADYFGKEATRLQQQRPRISKTVMKNDAEEQQHIYVADWNKEFALFIEADINKPAWQNSYLVDSVGLSVTYTSVDSALRTAEILVERSETGAVTHIHVTSRVSNMLYQSNEQLDYYVDSLYRITKTQDVRFIGKSHYTVTGEWLQ